MIVLINGKGDNMEKGKRPETINPWKLIWIDPRKTVRYAINHHWMKLAFLLAVVTGINSAWNETVQNAVESAYRSTGSLPETFMFIFVVGAILGLIGWVIGSAILTWVGGWLGGEGTYKELLIALGISGIPSVFLLGLNVMSFLIIGKKVFYGGSLANWQYAWNLLAGMIVVVISIWSIFITLKAIGEAHHFSAWRALATVILPVVILLIVVMVFSVLVFSLF